MAERNLLLLKLVNVEEVCRCCLSQESLIDLFGLKFEGLLICDIISELFSIQVNFEEERPKKICETCVAQVIQFYQFKKNIESTEETLSQILGKNSIKEENEINEAPEDPLLEDLVYKNEDENLREEPPNPNPLTQNDEKGATNNEKLMNSDVPEEVYLQDTKFKSDKTENENLQADTPNLTTQSELKLAKKRNCTVWSTQCVNKRYRRATSPKKGSKTLNYQATSDKKLINNDVLDEISLQDTKLISKVKSDATQNENLLQAELPQIEVKGAKKHNRTVWSPQCVNRRYRRAISPKKRSKTLNDQATSDEKLVNNDVFDNKLIPKRKSDATQAEAKGAMKLDCTVWSPQRVNVRYRRAPGPKRPCPFCSKLFDSSDMKRHLRTHQQGLFQCDKCPAKFTARLTFQRHKKRHTGEQSALCEICGKAVLDKYALKAHKLTHSSEHEHLCSICGEGFRYLTTYNYHMKKHREGKLPVEVKTEVKSLFCDLCSKEFKSKRTLKNHLLIHSGKKWSCEACDKVFRLKATLTHHYKTHHIEEKKEKKDKATYTCTHCSMVFKGRSYYEAHMKYLNDKDKKPIDFPETDYQCQVCSKYFLTKSNLTYHMGIHDEAKILCSVCGKKFNSKSALKFHSVVHTGEKRFSCDICNKKFSTNTWLKTHSFTHTGERPFVCTVCKKGFTQGPKLKIHMRTHTGERPYTCPHCNKSYPYHSYLVVHIRSHTGETPYVCDVCSKGFSHSSSLTKHKRTHFKESVAKEGLKCEEPILS